MNNKKIYFFLAMLLVGLIIKSDAAKEFTFPLLDKYIMKSFHDIYLKNKFDKIRKPTYSSVKVKSIPPSIKGSKYEMEDSFAEESLYDLEDANVHEAGKRKFDDYGHLRFGKRTDFDDYGHLRFGRSR